MELRRRVIREVMPSVQSDVPGFTEVEHSVYELTNVTPNADGFYEVPSSVHHVYPAMDAQNFLTEQGFRYVGKKKGQYDIELWRRMEDKKPTVEDLASPTGPSLDSVLLPSGFADKLPHGLQPLNMKNSEDSVCSRCATSLVSIYFDVPGLGTLKSVDIKICMNPQCDFHSVEVRRG